MGSKVLGNFVLEQTRLCCHACILLSLEQKRIQKSKKKKKKVELLTIKHQIFFYSTIEGPSKRLNKGTPMTFLR